MNNSTIVLTTDCHPESPIIECIENNDSEEFLRLLNKSVWNFGGVTVYTNIFL